LNKSDDQYFERFSKREWECIDAEAGVYALKKTFPSRINYYFFSGKLKREHLRSCLRQAERLLAEAKAIQDSLDNGRRLPKRFCINNPLVDVKYDYQTRLTDLPEAEALRLLLGEVINGREGCFCLTSNRDMPASEALRIYRSKDAIEKFFHSLKREIEVKPIRVWSEDAVHGVLLIGFIAQVMISLTRHFIKPVKRMSTKFIIASLKKFDSYDCYCRGRGQKEVLFEFQPDQQGHFGRISDRELAKNARKRAFSLRSRHLEIMCQILKPVQFRWINCQSKGRTKIPSTCSLFLVPFFANPWHKSLY
jgi:transposase